MAQIKLQLEANGDSVAEEEVISTAIIAGWTSRNREAVEEHIRELEELGVPRPDHTPCYYPVSASRLTNSPFIEVVGNDSSGEVEFALLMREGELWVGVGSDHTDRKVETYDVTVSKQMCDKPLASILWRFSEIESHWDQLKMRSYMVKDGQRTLYQEGTVAELLHPYDLIEQYEEVAQNCFADHSIMFGGTFAAIGGIQQSPCFEFELIDPVLDRGISHKYDINVI